MTKRVTKKIEWIVSGKVTFSGATCLVHARNRQEAIQRANDLENIDGIETSCAEVEDVDFGIAEPNVDEG